LLNLSFIHQPSNFKSSPFGGALIAGGAMAFSGIGDAALYPVLPVYGSQLGLSSFTIGLLLSVNRFIRLIVNVPIARFTEQLGYKKMMIITSTVAILTTLSYGLVHGLIGWLALRLLWGTCYSGLKTTTLGYAIVVPKNTQGTAVAFTQGIKSIGPLIAVYCGPQLIHYLGFQSGYLALAAISLPALFLSLYLTEPQTTISTAKTKKKLVPSSFNLLIMCLSIAIDGVLVVTLATMFGLQQNDSAKLAVIVGSYLLLYRFGALFMSFTTGFISLILAPRVVFNAAVLLSIVALFLIAIGQLISGIIMAFVFNAIVVALTPVVAIDNAEGSRLTVIATTSTWWDFGAATGVLIGIILIEQMGQFVLFFGLTLLVTLLFTSYLYRYGKRN
jgi:MFS family permease